MRLREMSPDPNGKLNTAVMDTCGVLRTCEIDGSGGVYALYMTGYSNSKIPPVINTQGYGCIG